MRTLLTGFKKSYLSLISNNQNSDNTNTKLSQEGLLVRVFILLFAANTISGCEWEERLDYKIQQLIHEHNLQGVGVVVVNSDEILYQKGFGYSNIEQQALIDNNTVFRVASLSKLFTTTAVMQLDESDALAIDEPLTRYLPDFFIQTRPDLSSDVNDISLRHMLTHRSGLPSDYFHSNYLERPPSQEEYSAQFANETLAQNPGEFFSYSNTAMSVLGEVVASVSGESFEDFMQNHILIPLNMGSSSFYFNESIEENLATPYQYDGLGTFTAIRHEGIAEIAAGALFSTTEDMANFMRSVLQDSQGSLESTFPRLLSEETYQEVFRAQNADNQIDALREQVIGLGWNLQTLPITYSETGAEDEVLLAFHGGSWSGFNSQLKLAPEEDIAVFVSTNTWDGWSGSEAIADFILESALENFKGATITPQASTIDDASPIAWSAEQLDAYVGPYNNPAEAFGFSVYAEEQQLFVAFGALRFRLQLMSDQSIRFHEDITDIQIPSVVASMQEIEGRRILYFEPFSLLGIVDVYYGAWLQYNPEPPAQAWLDRQGVYFFDGSQGTSFWDLLDPTSSDPENDFCVNLTYDGELLTLSELYGGSINRLGLVAYEANRAYMPGLGRGGGEAVWIDELGRLNWRGQTMEFIPQAADCASLQ